MEIPVLLVVCYQLDIDGEHGVFKSDVDTLIGVSTPIERRELEGWRQPRQEERGRA